MYQCQRAIAESSRIELIYPVVVEQSVCSFTNIAGDGPEVRDHEIQQITIKLLTHLIKPQTSVNWLIFFINVSTWYSFFLDVIVRLHSCVTLLRPFQKLEPYWIGSESDIWQPWNHHCQPLNQSLFRFHDAVTAMLEIVLRVDLKMLHSVACSLLYGSQHCRVNCRVIVAFKIS